MVVTVGGDLLVQPPRDDLRQDLALAGCKPGKCALGPRASCVLLLKPGGLRQRLRDGGKQVGRVDRLGKKVHRSILHRLGAGPDVAAPCQEDDAQWSGTLAKRALQLKSAQFRHREVEQHLLQLYAVAGHGRKMRHELGIHAA